MFYNKKGLLAEIKKTEQKISEKILVLEDLLDSAQKNSLVSKIDGETFFKSKSDETTNDPKKNGSSVDLKSNDKSNESFTEHRILSLEDAVNFNTNDDDEETLESLEMAEEDQELEFDDLEFTEVDSEDDDFESDDEEMAEFSDNEDDEQAYEDQLDEEWARAEEEIEGLTARDIKAAEDEKTLLGVKSIIQEARENMEKIDVSENIKIKSFKDVVLLARKIDHLK